MFSVAVCKNTFRTSKRETVFCTEQPLNVLYGSVQCPLRGSDETHKMDERAEYFNVAAAGVFSYH